MHCVHAKAPAKIPFNKSLRTMSIDRLVSSQGILKTADGDVLGCSYRWPSGQYCAIHTDRGIIGCGLYDCSVATRFGMALAIARGTPEHPLFEPADLLTACIVEVSVSAGQLGIFVGMTGAEALHQMLKE
ncbi:MAG: DUF1805 domain-containing protein [Planctomycetota bacterium]|nr:MAG: DUF1805 domain-containing protein [Planctomycetota bacterium]